MQHSRQLRRNPANGRVGGVAAGLSEYFGIDATLIRALLIVGTVFSSGVLSVVYLLCWALIPADRTRGVSHRRSKRRVFASTVFSAVLIFSAIGWLRNDGHWVLPVAAALITLLVAWLVIRKARGSQSWQKRLTWEKERQAWERRHEEQQRRSASQTNPEDDPFPISSFYPPPPSSAGDPLFGGTPYPYEGDQSPDDPKSGFQPQ